MKKTVLTSFTILCLLSTVFLMGYKIYVKAGPDVIYVPDDYEKIQWAVGNASTGDTILVSAGTYYEHVTINKSISLVGENRSTTIIDGNSTGRVVTVTADSVTITGFTVRNAGSRVYAYWDSCIFVSSSIGTTIVSNQLTEGLAIGVCLYNSNHSTIKVNELVGNGYQIFLHSSSCNNILSNNAIDNLGWDGISLQYSSNNNSIICNRLKNNHVGIYIDSSDYNRVEDNEITASSGIGVMLIEAFGNTLVANDVSNNANGMFLPGSSHNVIVGNTIAYTSERGLWFNPYGYSNIFYHNNFINNPIQIHSESIPINKQKWDNGYPSGGNYWSDCNSTDFYCGPYQNETSSDGIGDTPYVIDEDNQDNYPLMKPWTPIDTILPIIRIFSPQNVTYKTASLPLSFILYDPVHMSPISWIGYSLDGQANVTISENTPLTDLFYGVHNITVYANDTAGNMGISETVYFTILSYDLNDDGEVDIQDVYILIQAFGAYPDHPNWNPKADIDKDNRVDIRDIYLIIKNFGKTY